MKVLFLDIDGVLSSTRTWVAFGGLPHDLRPGLPRFDLAALGLVRNIVRTAEAHVVLSSAWRTTHDWWDVGEALDLPIISATPVGQFGERGREIAAWLQDHEDEVTDYAILDASDDVLPEQRARLVRTSEHDGLTFDCASKLAELLGVSIHCTSPARMPAPMPAATPFDGLRQRPPPMRFEQARADEDADEP